MRRRILSLPPLILILDNKDSFVWNLAQAFQSLGQEVRVRRSDQITPEQVDEDGLPRALVISPGPGIPEDAGHSVALTGISGA